MESTQPKSKYTYGYWRTDKEKEAGFSYELISSDSKSIVPSKTDLDSLYALPFEGCDTLYKCIQRNKAKIPNHEWMGVRNGPKYEWMTYKDSVDMAEVISHGVVALGLSPEIEAEGKMWKFMGIQSKNRREQYIVHLGNQHQNITTVAFYDTLGPDATRYVINQTELTTMTVSLDYVSKISKLKLGEKEDDVKMKTLANLVVFEKDIPQADRDVAAEAGLTLYTLDEVIAKGKESVTAGTSSIVEPKPDDCFMFSYTSGTTGDPKGVKLTHKMIIGAAYAVNTRMGKVPFTHNDSYICYLPFSHSFEQAVLGIGIVYGIQIGFFGGDVLKLTEDMGILKPTFFPSVPRLFNRIYGKLKDKMGAATGLKKMLVDSAISAKAKNLKSGKGLTHSVYDAIVFKNAKKLLGGRVRIMITGSAPISGEVLDFLKIAFCAELVEGYGMTETCAGSCTTFLGDPQSGIVGGPLQNVKIRLRDIPEMGYLSSNDPPKGEICFWGPSIMKGYFKNEEKTNEAFHDGWLLSGDVGMVFPNGAMKIIDRAKNIFKLSQGEYIAPEKLENVYIQSSFVAQVWMYGDSLRDFVVGFLVVDPDAVKRYYGDKWADSKMDTLNEDQDLVMAVYKSLMDLAGANKFNSLEKPKQIQLLKDPFTIENDILTPTMKLKRNIAKQIYAAEIDKMYSLPPMKLK